MPSPTIIPATRRRIRLPRSAKVITGATLFAMFVFLAIFGSALAPYDPGAIATATNGMPQPPSAAHLLGTTNSGRTCCPSCSPGPGRSCWWLPGRRGATVLSVLIGVAAGYFGGLVDDCCPC